MIRTATEEDIPRLSELFSELHRYHCDLRSDMFIMPEQEFFVKRITEILQDSTKTVLVSENGIIEAYAVVVVKDVNQPDRVRRRVCLIDCFAVGNLYRRQGIGTELFSYITDFAREKGCNSLQLGVNAYNREAQAFYEKMGLAPRTIIMSKQI